MLGEQGLQPLGGQCAGEGAAKRTFEMAELVAFLALRHFGVRHADREEFARGAVEHAAEGVRRCLGVDVIPAKHEPQGGGAFFELSDVLCPTHGDDVGLCGRGEDGGVRGEGDQRLEGGVSLERLVHGAAHGGQAEQGLARLGPFGLHEA